MAQAHYDQLAEDFDQLWDFSQGYRDWVVARVGECLALSPQDVFADVGGGTGLYTQLIHQAFSPQVSWVVEPAQAMADEAAKRLPLQVCCGELSTFLATQPSVSKLLFKEVIHHIPQRPSLWRALHAHLPAHGRLLIITRPQWLDWPLFESAKAAFAQHQPPLASIEAEFAQSGFTLEVAAHTYAFTLPKATWHQMLRARFISDLHALTDAQIEVGIAQLEAQNPAAHYTIPDKLLFILAKK